MPYITREDGEHFVIPSYRDVLTAKQASSIKKDVLALSQSYGEFITMQRKGQLQFEIAFSPDTGYLLGETAWYKFDRPTDMIYCEAIPSSTEAILVIVKNGSVYLDGSFQKENIPEELVIFLTQQNNFEIFVYGDVPIAATATEGKFCFDETSVKSFTVLDQPVFNNLPLVEAYHLQPVDVTLKKQGVGKIPMLYFGMAIVGAIIAYYAYGYASVLLAEQKKQETPMEVNPYADYVTALNTPAPDLVVQEFVDSLKLLRKAPGWVPVKVEFKGGAIAANMVSRSGVLESLFSWATQNGLSMTVKQTGIMLGEMIASPKRTKPKIIYPAKQVLMVFIDKLMQVYPGYSNLSLAESKASGPFSRTKIAIKFANITPDVLALIGQQLEGLPFTIDSITVTIQDSALISGTLTVNAFGT